MPFVGWNLFLARLIGGSGASQTKKAANDPQHRLAKFKRTYSQSLQIWHKFPSSKPDSAALDIIQANLQRLTRLLEDDTRAPAPHLCLSFAASSYFYTAINRIALAAGSEGIVREAVAIFTLLVDNDEDNLLGTERFAETLMNFVDSALGYNTYVATSETQGEVLELMFGIAAKIRLEPELLPVWFRRSTSLIPTEKGDDSDDEAPEKIDFPLCHQFVGHVYHEGRVGDFARTGLLYMFESASNSPPLESWIVDSDLPTLLASGLGALYSQLSRKLQIAYPKGELPLILALSENHHERNPADAESFYSEDLQARLSTFMSYMVFWQDVLKQCFSPDIKQTLIDHFQVFFLQQILYPSLLESSDADGGSSVAVLTYLWTILDSIEHPDIIHMILDYLLALSEPLDSSSETPRSPVAEKRRQDLLTLSVTDLNEDAMTPSFFNLTDMILASCQSHNAETVTSALRLVNVILTKYHSYALSSLLRTVPANYRGASRAVGTLNQELDFLVVLARDIGGVEGMDEAYDASLRDSLAFIESHACSKDMFAITELSTKAQLNRRTSMLKSESRTTHKHGLDPDDPLLKLLVDLLSTFFSNTIEVNLGLTSVLTHLASCPLTQLEGWLVRGSPRPVIENEDSTDIDGNAALPSSDEVSEEQEKLEQERVNAFKAQRAATSWGTSEAPVFAQVLQTLLESLNNIKAGIPEFDSLVASRKRAFQGATEIENELRDPVPSMLSPRLSSDQSRDTSRTRARLVASPSPKRNPQDTLGSSPRGRTLSAIAGQQRSPAASPKADTRKRPKPLSSPKFPPREESPAGSRSPSKLARAMSPLKMAHNLSDDDEAMSETASNTGGGPSATEEIFERKIQFPVTLRAKNASGHVRESDAEDKSPAQDEDEASVHGGDEPKVQIREATLTHVLTNVVILQEFILEIAAIIQVRAGLLDGEIMFV